MEPPQKDEVVDVVIIGAGMAGITAAYELVRHGVDSVVVLEASHRSVATPTVHVTDVASKLQTRSYFKRPSTKLNLDKLDLI